MIHDDEEVDHGGHDDHDDDGHNVHDIHDDENSAQSHYAFSSTKVTSRCIYNDT